MTDRPDAGEFVDPRLEDAAQAVFAVSESPLAMTGELLAALQGRAMRSAMEARVRLIVAQGHTGENDDLLPIGMLPLRAGKALIAAREQMHGRCCGDHGALEVARALLVEGVALGLAAIDRLDRGMKAGER